MARRLGQDLNCSGMQEISAGLTTTGLGMETLVLVVVVVAVFCTAVEVRVEVCVDVMVAETVKVLVDDVCVDVDVADTVKVEDDCVNVDVDVAVTVKADGVCVEVDVAPVDSGRVALLEFEVFDAAVPSQNVYVGNSGEVPLEASATKRVVNVLRMSICMEDAKDVPSSKVRWTGPVSHCQYCCAVTMS